MTEPPVTAAATFCATLVDEWVRAGVTHAVVAPGSRSTPMALALAADHRFTVAVVHDERSAAFRALGVGLATGRPAIVLTTSGTAAAELHPAIVEADLSGVPLIACTADRPPELQDVGAPQTIDQTHLFGRSTRWFTSPEVPDAARCGTWRPLGARSVAEAVGDRPGPVHLNLAFRDPLVGSPGELPPGRPDGGPWSRPVLAVRSLHQVEDAAALMDGKRGAVVAGDGTYDGRVVLRLADALGWPVLSGPRGGVAWPRDRNVVAHADALLRAPGFATAHVPEVILRLGGAPTSKFVAQWSLSVPIVAVHPKGRWLDPDGNVAVSLHANALEVLAGEPWTAAPTTWREDWQRADEAAARAIEATLSEHPEPTEPGVARDLVAALPDHSTLVVSSSMPIRDVEWYAAPRDRVRVLCNRGANGIDGVVSTAIGVALASERPTVALVGDVAFLHDASALTGLAAQGLALTIVVVDNDGGGIFSFLPQGEVLDRDRFELLFGTPHGVDLAGLAAAHGLDVRIVDQRSDLGPAVANRAASGRTSVVLVRTDRAQNVAIHDQLHAAVATALADLDP